jgi:MFS family permease
MLSVENKAEEEVHITSIIGSRDFVLLYLISFCHVFYGYYIIGTYKTIGGIGISDDRFLTLIGSFGSLFNGLSRILWSSLLDCYSFNRVFRTLSMIQILLIATVLWSVKYQWIYFVVVSLSMMCEGALTSILPTETLHHFREKRGHQVYAFMFSSFGASGIVSSVIVLLFQYTVGFTGMLAICMVLSVAAFALTFVYDSNNKFKYSRLSRREEIVAIEPAGNAEPADNTARLYQSSQIFEEYVPQQVK